VPRETIEELFDELAAADLPVPARARVVARGRQRRLRSRVTMAVSTLAVLAVAVSAFAYVQYNVGRSGQGRPSPSTSRDRHARPRLPATLPAAPPPGSSPLLLGVEEVQGPAQPSWNLVMTRIGSATKLARLSGLPPGAADQSKVATDPAGGWVISYATSQNNLGPERERLATVSTSGVVRSFGPAFTDQVAITALAVRPDGSAVAVAITHLRRTDAAPKRPAQIELIPLPGRNGGIRTWALASASWVRTMVENMSWSPDGAQLTYMPGGDETGGGFASDGVVTLSTSAAGDVAPSVPDWPPFEKGAGQCALQAGAWQASTGDYLALEQCGSDLAVVAVNPVTGANEGRAARMPDMGSYFGCGSPMLDPAPHGTEVLISGCGLIRYDDGHLTAVNSPLAGATAWAGQPGA
jgi:hypothetical protein